LASAAQSETAGDWPAALQHYESAVKNDAGLSTVVDSAVARVKARMKAEGTDAFRRARQYDALNRVDDAVTWYERAFRNLPDGDPDRRTAGERLNALKTGR
jgi:tetratricopeptide (TPR) repeat protein